LGVLGIDIGTNGCKGVLIDSEGRICGTSYKEYSMYFPQTGWVEHDPEEVMSTVIEVIKGTLRDARCEGEAVEAVGLCSHMHSPTFVGKDGRHLYNMIVWLDQRSVKEAKYIKDKYGEVVYQETLNPITATFTLPQILWMKRHKREIYDKSWKILQPKDYVAFRMTGEAYTDRGMATSTLLVNIHTLEWSNKILELFEIDREKLPDIVNATNIIGEITEEFSEYTGISRGTPVVAGSGDAIAECFAAGIKREGDLLLRMGTAGALFVAVEKPVEEPTRSMFNFGYAIPNVWLAIATTQTCGLSLRWFRDVFCRKELEEAERRGISVYEILNKMAEGVPAGSEGLIFHPYLIGERGIYWDPYLRGSFVGITASHKLDHFVRAVMEGVAFSLRDALRPLEHLKIGLREVKLIGGGSKSKVWREIVSNVLNIEVHIPTFVDASLGSALLGAVGQGIFKNMEEAVEKTLKIGTTVKPNIESVEKYNKIFEIYREIHDGLEGINHRLVGLQESK